VRQLLAHDLRRADQPAQHQLVDQRQHLWRTGTVEYERTVQPRLDERIDRVIADIGLGRHQKGTRVASGVEDPREDEG
jgi:hypothetical protein